MTYKLDNSFVNEANDIDIDTFSLVPEGEYIGKPTQIEHKKFDSQSGFQIKFVITEGSQSGMSVNLFICLESNNEMALKFAKVNLKKLFIAAGFDSVKTDLSLVLDHKMRFSVSHRAKNGKTFAGVNDIFENLMPDGRINTPANKSQAASTQSQPQPTKARSDAPF